MQKWHIDILDVTCMDEVGKHWFGAILGCLRDHFLASKLPFSGYSALKIKKKVVTSSGSDQNACFRGP